MKSTSNKHFLDAERNSKTTLFHALFTKLTMVTPAASVDE